MQDHHQGPLRQLRLYSDGVTQVHFIMRVIKNLVTTNLSSSLPSCYDSHFSNHSKSDLSLLAPGILVGFTGVRRRGTAYTDTF